MDQTLQEQLAALVDLAAVVVVVELLALAVTAVLEYFIFSIKENL
jgi:hypothetical protein